GLTPALRYHSSELDYWVRDFIPGTPLAAAPSDDDLQAVTKVLATVHAQRPRANLHTLDVQAACAQYLAQCDGHSEAVIRLKEEVSQLTPLPADDACLCHLDPLPANWLRDSEDKLWLLDWEYAALAHPSLDYAALQLQLPENKQALFESFIPENLREVMADARTQVRLMDRSWRLAHATG
ncbi:MAG: phosphotransferase, partial [Pseudomonadota bacterium]|nr:phosphotransferase [Pseudomonadota bacterium]